MRVSLALLSVLLLGNAAPSSNRRTPVVAAVEKVSGAVVSVTVEAMVEVRSQSPFFGFFDDFEPRQKRRQTASQGSGVVIDPNGLVLTNYHVIAVGGDVILELTSGKRVPAEVVGTAPDHDLAVLKAKSPQPIPFVPMGSSADLMIGEPVIAIGNPFGLSHTVTTGVVSALNRSIQAEDRTYLDFIQTDASINPGNSGGPLLNIDGALIGINTAIYGKAQGIGFAIPIDKARRIVDDLLKHGEVRRPYFGFETQDLSPELSRSFGLSEAEGVLVAQVDPKGPANSVLREGDVVVQLDGRRVASAQELRTRLGDTVAGARVTLELLRNGKKSNAEIIATALSPEDALRRLRERTGLEMVELDEAEARRSRLPKGIILIGSVAKGSPAARMGLRPGDWVRAVNSEKVLGMTDFGKSIARSYWRGQALLLVQRGRAWQQIAFDL